ncbi:MAG: type I restriction enzyme HsdR N-terminal domain-containing protein [Bacteroidota bacterium]|nr:type I restriction enzyme HsdR N-terminal domain-containing protein [Bacteroidota bacterium]
MQRLNLPTYSFNIKSLDKGKQIFDICRKKWVALTPEEWVRQHLLHYFTTELNYPAGLVAIELSIRINGLDRRCDMVVFNRRGIPVMIVECKAPDVKLEQIVFDQVARYNLDLQVSYLLISNGKKHFCALLDQSGKNYRFLDNFPDYSTLDSHS